MAISAGPEHCAACGASLRDDAPPQQNAYQQQPYSNQYAQQPNNQYQNPQQQYYQPPMASPIKPAHPMKWYKFLIYFMLFFGAVLNIASAVAYFTGAMYINPYNGSNVADLVYARWSELETIDLVMGLSCLVMAVFAIVTRFRLSGYYKNAGSYVFALYVIGAVVNLVYTIALYLIVDGDEEVVDISTSFVGFAWQIVIAFCNKTYFEKRKDLFYKE